MPSSVNVGARSRSAKMRAYSRSLRLCSRTTSGVMARSPGNGSAPVATAERGAVATPGSATLGLSPVPAEGHQHVIDDPAEQTGVVLMRANRLELAGIQPDAPALPTVLDLHAMEFLAPEIVAVLGTLHEMGPPFGGHPGRLGQLTLLLEELLIEQREVFLFVLAGLLGGRRILKAK